MTHASELPYVFGANEVESTDDSVRLLSAAMLDYWLSFVVSGTPNDGKGVASACLCLVYLLPPLMPHAETEWPQYTPDAQVSFDVDSSVPVRALLTVFAQNLVQLDTASFSNTSFASFDIIPDTYREEQISFINSVASDFAQ